MTQRYEVRAELDGRSHVEVLHAASELAAVVDATFLIMGLAGSGSDLWARGEIRLIGPDGVDVIEPMARKADR